MAEVVKISFLNVKHYFKFYGRLKCGCHTINH